VDGERALLSFDVAAIFIKKKNSRFLPTPAGGKVVLLDPLTRDGVPIL